MDYLFVTDGLPMDYEGKVKKNDGFIFETKKKY